MAKLKHQYFEEYCDCYGYSKILLAIDMEEKGVIYTYSVRDKECQVSAIEKGTDDVVIADEINVYGVGICPVVRWGIPFSEKECLSNVKSVVLGRNIVTFNDLTTSELDKLERLVIPESIDKFPPFNECYNLREITMSDKYSLDLEEFTWSHPKLQKITFLHEGNKRDIGEKELSSKRLSYQIKLDKEEKKRIKEEKAKQHQETIRSVIERYIGIICAIPYIWVTINGLKMIGCELGFPDIIMSFIAWGVLLLGLFLAWGIAVGSAVYMVEHSEHKIVTALFAPVLTVPFSWIIFSIALGLLTAFNSCSDGFYGIIDPRFISCYSTSLESHNVLYHWLLCLA